MRTAKRDRETGARPGEAAVRSPLQNPPRMNRRKALVALPRKNKIRVLPRELKKELDRRLAEGDFSSHRALSAWLLDNGYKISPASLHKYGRHFERRLDAIKIATEQAKIVVEAAGGDDPALEEALMRLVQTELFGILTAIQSAKNEPEKVSKGGAKDNSKKEPLENSGQANLHAIARSVVNLGKLSIMQKRWNAEARRKIEKQVGAVEKKLEKARDAGLSPDAAAQIRSALLEVRI
ncbi:MAG TPA: phage protein Gp27 family protein [Candidatus Binataceae bacterium]